MSDVNDLSSDPYIRATLTTTYGSSDTLHTHTINFRTHTERRTLNPEFHDKWIVSGVPASGFTLTLRLRDEDPGNHNDRLGKSIVSFPLQGQQIDKDWSSGETECKVHKRKGSLKSKLTTFGARVLTCGNIDHHCRILLSVKVLGRAQAQNDTRLYTIGPRAFLFPLHMLLYSHIPPIRSIFPTFLTHAGMLSRIDKSPQH